MKSHHVLLFLTLTLCGLLPALAQDEPADGPKKDKQDEMQEKLIETAHLADDEKTRYIAARTKAFADNPGLKQEGQTLLSQMEDLHKNPKATRDEKLAMRQKLVDYNHKVEEAMLREAPSVQSILDKIDEARQTLRAQHAQEKRQQAAQQPQNQ